MWENKYLFQSCKRSSKGNQGIIFIPLKSIRRTENSVIVHLKRYIKLTQDLRSFDKVFVSCTKAHQPISRDTISRWCKTLTELSGIDIQKYYTHSTR